MNKDESRNIIWQISDLLRGTLNGNTLIFGCMKLLFLKYATDNYLGATTPEEMKYYANAQKTFAMRDIENGTDFIAPILITLDKAYNLSRIMFSEELLSDYGMLLLGTDKRKNKVGASDEAFKKIMGILGALNLEEDEAKTVGKSLVEAFIDEQTRGNYKSKFSAEYSSTISLAKLAKGILQVEADDTFCDFTAGVGVSTIIITNDCMPKVVCSDINREAAVMTAMMLVMYGYREFDVLVDDSLTKGAYFDGATKIFVDPPIGVRIDSFEDGAKVESQLLALREIKRHLTNVEGKAVVAVPAGTLFQSNGRPVSLRKELVELGMVDAVVSLPPLWSGSSAGTNLVVLSSGNNKNILFVDATAAKEKEDFYDGDMNSDKTLKYIIDVVNERREIPGFSKITENSMLDDAVSLVPTNYVERIRKTNYRSLETVDDELRKLYEMLNIKSV